MIQDKYEKMHLTALKDTNLSRAAKKPPPLIFWEDWKKNVRAVTMILFVVVLSINGCMIFKLL